MPPKNVLRVATEDDAPPAPPAAPERKKPLTLAEAIETGSYLEILMAQRRQMVEDVKHEKGPARAALHRQIALHSKEIAALEAAAKQEQATADGGDVPDEPFDASAV